MARGFLAGLVVGGVISVVGLGTVSLLSPLPPSPDVSGAPGAGAAPSDPDEGDRPETGRDADLVELPPTAPKAGDGADTLNSLEDSDTRPADKPAVGAGTGALTEPSAAGRAPDVAPEADNTPSGDQVATAPSTPDADTTPQPVARDSATRPEVSGATGSLEAPGASGSAPDVAADDGNGAPAGRVTEAPSAPAPSDSSPQETDTSSGDRPSVGGASAGLNSPSAAGSAPDVSAVAKRPAAPAQPSGGLTAPQGEDQPISSEPAQPVAPTVTENSSGFRDDAPEVASDGPAQPTPAEPTETEPGPRIAALPQSGVAEEEDRDAGPTIGTRVKPLTERDSRSSRLPSVTQVAEDEEEGAVPPIVLYAAPFENPEKKPLMAIVLIDDTRSFGAEALQEFPYPLTFALNPNDPDAQSKLGRYRDAGFEAALLTNLPEAANAQDAEVALEAALAALPETVAVFEGVGSGFQGNRELSNQVTAIAGASGRGMVTQSNGLNTVQKLAARQGVPSAVVFRDFDGAGQTPDTIRRFLDQAAFRADQEGVVIMLGRVRPETISALLLWGLQDRASRVALSPLSAALLRDTDN